MRWVDQMSGLQLFAVSVAVYAVLPLVFALLPSPYRALLLYTHLAAVLALGGLLGAVYVLPLHGDVVIPAGQLAYGAFLYASLIAVITGRNIQVVRNVVALTVLVSVLTYLLSAIGSAALAGRHAANPLGIPVEVFDHARHVVLGGGVLVILELVVLVAILEPLKGRLPSWAMVPVYPLVFVALLSLDGALFPLAFGLPADQLASSVSANIQATALMGLVFALPMLGFVLAYRRTLAAYEVTPVPVRELLLLHQDLMWSHMSTANATLAGILRSPSNTLLVVADPDLRVVAANLGLERVLGWAPTEVVGRPISEVWSRSRPDEQAETVDPRDFLEEAIVLGSNQVLTVRHRDGSLRELSLSFSHVTDDDGRFVGYLLAGEDVSSRVKTERALEEALDQERESQRRREEAVRFREDLVTVVSHELRTPIASIAGYTELLAEGQFGDLSESQEDALRRISRNSRRLKTLVDDLLLLAGSGTAEVSRHEPVDLRTVVSHVEERARELANGRSIELFLDLPDDPVTVAGDQASLERLLLNLVSNAVKFSERGTIRVTVSDDDAQALLRVSDEGFGMSPDEVSQAFIPFYRTRIAAVRAIQGSGLGLSVVARIAEQHSGDVALDSTPGAGTTVTVRLAQVSRN
jgi:PAS domain S-box-containing protein